MAKRPHDHDDSQGKRHVRFKRDIVPLSSIFDKESKSTTINKSCRHSCITAIDHEKNNQSKDDLRPLTQLRKTDDTQERGAAFDPGNEILDGGEGKNNMQKHFFETNTNVTGTSQDNANIREQDTTRHLPGLSAPTLQTTGQPVQGDSRSRHRKENKAKRRQQQSLQCNETYWTTHKGEMQLTNMQSDRPHYRNSMCPTGLALKHPAASTLLEYSKYGCPTQTGKEWTKLQIWEAVERGPHVSALSAEALEHFREEAREKVATGQATIVEWDKIKNNPPPQMKVSPIAAIPHKSKAFRSILDLSFSLRLQDGTKLPSVNDSTTKTAPAGAINQLGHALQRVIHAFAEATEDDKIFMAKWDIKDGFWRLDANEGDEWNFAYVLPQPPGEPIKIVIPTSLQMGWVESPPYFCVATETSRDIATTYCETEIGTLPSHKFDKHVSDNDATRELPDTPLTNKRMRYLIEVYVDDFMAIVIPTTKEDVTHVGRAVMHGIHDVFPADDNDANDPISEKKLLKREGEMSTTKTLLGFDFDGIEKTMWLESAKRDQLLTILHSWIKTSERSTNGIPFKEFESVVAKIRHAFTALPAGLGLLSPCNAILRTRKNMVYLQRNMALKQALTLCRTLLRESTAQPTRCKELVRAWPDYIGICDASSFGFGGVIVGENSECPPTVVRLQWPSDITDNVKSDSNPRGTITNSDLEMAGLLLVFLVMEEIIIDLKEKNIALFSDNTPTVSWVTRLASRHSIVAANLVAALALRLKRLRCCPLTPQHIKGIENTITDIPSRSFGSVPQWHFKSNDDLRTFFNDHFPLPNQVSWNVFQFHSGVAMRVISLLRIKHSSLDEWRRLPKIGSLTGVTGPNMSRLWDWTLIYRTHHLHGGSEPSLDSQHEHDKERSAQDAQYNLEQSLAMSRPLARRSLWPAEPTRSNH